MIIAHDSGTCRVSERGELEQGINTAQARVPLYSSLYRANANNPTYTQNAFIQG